MSEWLKEREAIAADLVAREEAAGNAVSDAGKALLAESLKLADAAYKQGFLRGYAKGKCVK